PDGKFSGEADIKLSTELGKLFAAQPELAPFADKRLDENGLTAEGIAVRNGRLYAGLRGPSLGRGTRAAILSVSVAALFDGAAPAADVGRSRTRAGRGRPCRVGRWVSGDRGPVGRRRGNLRHLCLGRPRHQPLSHRLAGLHRGRKADQAGGLAAARPRRAGGPARPGVV